MLDQGHSCVYSSACRVNNTLVIYHDVYEETLGIVTNNILYAAGIDCEIKEMFIEFVNSLKKSWPRKLSFMMKLSPYRYRKLVLKHMINIPNVLGNYEMISRLDLPLYCIFKRALNADFEIKISVSLGENMDMWNGKVIFTFNLPLSAAVIRQNRLQYGFSSTCKSILSQQNMESLADKLNDKLNKSMFLEGPSDLHKELLFSENAVSVTKKEYEDAHDVMITHLTTINFPRKNRSESGTSCSVKNTDMDNKHSMSFRRKSID
jgi:hypothetical protein